MRHIFRLSAISISTFAFFAAAACLGLAWVLPSVLTSMGVRTIYVEGTRAILAMSLCLTLALLIRRPVVSALPFLAVAMAGQYLGKLSYGDDTLALKRSFFGVHHVYTVAARSEGRIDPTKPAAHKLMHGTTLHGAQLFGTLERKRPDGSVFSSDAERLATTYYHPNGPVGDIMRHLANLAVQAQHRRSLQQRLRPRRRRTKGGRRRSAVGRATVGRAV